MTTYARRQWGPLIHVLTAEQQRHGMTEETWRLGPFDLTRHYVTEDKRYGDWTFSATFGWRRWRGPWLHFAFGTGAQNWDEDEL